MLHWQIARFHDGDKVMASVRWRDITLQFKMHKYVWTFLTALATWASLVWLCGQTVTLIFILSIFIHELGHAFVGRWVGLRKVNIEFVPFFGGRTYAISNFANQRDMALMVLAGPVSGLMFAWIGYASYAFTGWEPLRLFAAFNAAVSLINLLPVSPMDGGHIVSALLSPLRVTAIMWLEIAVIALACVIAYFAGVRAVILLTLWLAAMLVIVWHMRKVIDAERVMDAVAGRLGLDRTDFAAVIFYLNVSDDEELLETAAAARKKRRRFLVGRPRYITDDRWFVSCKCLAYVLQAFFQPPVTKNWKVVLAFLLVLTAGLCALLCWLLIGSEESFQQLLQYVISLYA